jgi:hypothetical protein
MHKIQNELNEDKEKCSKFQRDNEEIKDHINKDDEFTKMQSLN